MSKQVIIIKEIKWILGTPENHGKHAILVSNDDIRYRCYRVETGLKPGELCLLKFKYRRHHKRPCIEAMRPRSNRDAETQT